MLKYELEEYPELSSLTINFIVNDSLDDDDHCAFTVSRELLCSDDEAFEICDKIWDKYGRS